jgi:hypothetical protein
VIVDLIRKELLAGILFVGVRIPTGTLDIGVQKYFWKLSVFGWRDSAASFNI